MAAEQTCRIGPSMNVLPVADTLDLAHISLQLTVHEALGWANPFYIIGSHGPSERTSCRTKMPCGPPLFQASRVAAEKTSRIGPWCQFAALPMRLSWLTAAQNKSCSSSGMGPFHTLYYTEKQLGSHPLTEYHAGPHGSLCGSLLCPL